MFSFPRAHCWRRRFFHHPYTHSPCRRRYYFFQLWVGKPLLGPRGCRCCCYCCCGGDASWYVRKRKGAKRCSRHWWWQDGRRVPKSWTNSAPERRGCCLDRGEHDVFPFPSWDVRTLQQSPDCICAIKDCGWIEDGPLMYCAAATNVLSETFIYCCFHFLRWTTRYGSEGDRQNWLQQKHWNGEELCVYFRGWGILLHLAEREGDDDDDDDDDATIIFSHISAAQKFLYNSFHLPGLLQSRIFRAVCSSPNRKTSLCIVVCRYFITTICCRLNITWRLKAMIQIEGRWTERRATLRWGPHSSCCSSPKLKITWLQATALAAAAVVTAES